jgi:hypothetical protein
MRSGLWKADGLLGLIVVSPFALSSVSPKSRPGMHDIGRSPPRRIAALVRRRTEGLVRFLDRALAKVDLEIRTWT